MRSIVDMLFVFNEDLTISLINEKACQLLNRTEDNLVGMHLADLFPKRQKKFVEGLLSAIQEEKHVYNLESQFKVKGKKSLPVSISFSMFETEVNEIGFLLIAKDMQHFLMTTDALKQKNEELETLVYRVSHDLKGPLASVTGLFQLLEHEEKTVENLEYYLNLIRESTAKLENTLSGLLEVGLSSNEGITQRKFNVRSNIEKLLGGFNAYPGREDVIFLLSANPDLTLSTEEQTFNSILQNLIENSIKYRKPYISDSVTKISARKYKNGIKIKVKDNGQGMSRQVQQRAFDMFYRGNQISQGSGLGLFIVKSNVQKLGGEIRIKSQIDHGTEMWIYLPNFNETRRKSLLIKDKKD